MNMYRPTRERLAKLVAKLGTSVTTDQIRPLEESGELERGTLTAVRNYAKQLSRKEFDLAGIVSNFKEELDDLGIGEEYDSQMQSEPAPEEEAVSGPQMATPAPRVVVDNTKNNNGATASTFEVPIPKKDSTFVPDTSKGGSFTPLKKILESGIFAPVYITGLSGNGKTFTVEQVCARTKRPLVIFNVTNETTEEDLIGHYVLVEGNLIWRDGPVLTAYRQGAVLCLDEIDQGTSRLMCLQTILQRKPYFVKKTNETVYPADGFMVVATGNTKGTGDETDRFIGAQIMNEAFLERFPVTIHQDYPTAAVEKRILNHHIDDADLVSRLVAWAQQTRKDSDDGYIDAITTRRLVDITKTIPAFGDAAEAIMYGTNRFGEESRDALVKAFELITIDSDVVTDGDDRSTSDTDF